VAFDVGAELDNDLRAELAPKKPGPLLPHRLACVVNYPFHPGWIASPGALLKRQDSLA
jgi:hypothetical protein